MFCVVLNWKTLFESINQYDEFASGIYSDTMVLKIKKMNMPRLWIEHRAFRSSVWRSPNWAIEATAIIPIQGLEPWYPAWKASMLTTYIISELLFFAAHKFQKIIHSPKQLDRKYSINLLPSLMLLIVTFYQSIMVLRRSQLYFHFTRCLPCFVYQLWMTEDKQNDS